MDKTLKIKANKKFSSNPTGMILLGVFFCLVTIGSIALDLVFSGLFLLALLLIVFPLLTGTILTSYSIDYIDRVEFKGLLNCSTKYFTPQLYGSYRFIISFLKSILVEIIATFVVGIITHFIFASSFGASYNDAVEMFTKSIADTSMEVENINQILEMNNGILITFGNTVTSIASILGISILLFLLSFNSLAVNFRVVLNAKNAGFAKRAVIQTLHNNRKSIYKDYLYLNWPLIVLCLTGLVGGTIVSIMVPELLSVSLEVSLMAAFACMMLYFPKYLANMAAIFDKYQSAIIMGVNDSVRDAIMKIQSTLDLSEEDKQHIEETLKQLEEDNKEIKEEENKKDPDSGS